MAEIFRDDKIALRECILYEVLDKKPIFDSYKSLCKRLGNDAIEYIDFEYWYMRFVNGKLDLNYDRSLDPKTISFSELSDDTIGEIFEKLDSKSRLVARKVSRNLRSVIDKQRSNCESISITIVENEILLDGEFRVRYIHQDDGCLVVHNDSGKAKKVDNGDYVELALNDLAYLMKKPKVQLKRFGIYLNRATVDLSEKCLCLIESVLKSLKSPLPVTFLHMEVNKTKGALSILPHLKAGTLERIELFTKKDNPVQLEKIKNLEQWKEAKMADEFIWTSPDWG